MTVDRALTLHFCHKQLLVHLTLRSSLVVAVGLLIVVDLVVVKYVYSFVLALGFFLAKNSSQP